VALGRQRDRARGQVTVPVGVVPFPQGHVDRPVGASRFAEFPGAVERVDDPDPFGRKSRGVVRGLLGQDDVAGSAAAQLSHQELMRQPVARVAQHVRLVPAGAQLKQPLPRLFGKLTG